MTDFFIVGDVHGCYHTFNTMLERHWKSDSEGLIQLGDFVLKGAHTYKTIKLLFDLQKNNENVHVLSGNNEFLWLQRIRNSDQLKYQRKFFKQGLSFEEAQNWLVNLPTYWTNDYLFCSHAGISEKQNYPENLNQMDLIFNRLPLKKIDKTQFLGHIVRPNPKFVKKCNAWYLDTGAGNGEFLSGAKVDQFGHVKELIMLPIDNRDIK